MNDNVLNFPSPGRVLEHRSLDPQLPPPSFPLSYLHRHGDEASHPTLESLLRIIGTHIEVPRRVCAAAYENEERSIIAALEAAHFSAARVNPTRVPDEVLIPASAHESIPRLVEDMGLRPVLVRVDPFTDLASPRAMAQALSRRSLLILASAPTPSDGIVDPVSELAALAAGHGVWLHVDATAGGFLLPYEARLVPELAEFRFWTPGVSSVAVNISSAPALHGGPVAMFARRAEIGELGLAPSELGESEARDLLASLRSLGDAGHLELVMRGVEARARLLDYVENHPDLALHPRGGLREVQFSHLRADSRILADALHGRGWWLRTRPCPRTGIRRICVPINPASAEHIRRLIADIEALLPRR